MKPAIRLRQVCLVTRHLDLVLDQLQEVFDLQVCHRDPAVKEFGLKNALLRVGSRVLEVVAPVAPDTAAGRFLKRRSGDSGYMVIMQASAAEQEAGRRRAASAGIRVAWEKEHATGRYLQFHPADTGGAFFELDHDEANDPGGHWQPAGGLSWQNAPQSTVIRDLVGVGLQAGAPAAMAATWSQLAGIPLQGQRLPLTNGHIDFALATDGRGDGLGGITLLATDPDRARQRARAAGLTVTAGHILLCGTRFQLITESPHPDA